MKCDYDIIINGAGATGLSAALALSQAGFKTALIDAIDFKHEGQSTSDPRASTLAATSLNMMRRLGLNNALAPHLQVIKDMMIGEGRPGQISPLTLHFDTSERDVPMGAIIENSRLLEVLRDAAEQADNLSLYLGRPLSDFSTTSAFAKVILETGTELTAPLIIAADGRNSFLRKAAGIAVAARDYDQAAVVTTVSHTRPHGGVAQQLFFSGGPFALLPLIGNRTSLVWSDRKAAVKAAMALDDTAFLSELERRFGDHLGALTLDGPRLSYPLSLQMAESYTSERLALIGDAAHVVHPIAGQGLNMGLRDVAALTDVLSSARATGLDIGGAELATYEQWRAGDNRLLGIATDQLNHLFSNQVTPLRHLRRLGLAAVDKTSFAQKFFMSEAAGELGDLPPLLRA